MGSIKVFLIEPTGIYRPALRRYASGSKCVGKFSFHNASRSCPEMDTAKEGLPNGDDCMGDLWPHDDKRWPAKCDYCDYHFTDSDEWQFRAEELYEHEGQRYTRDEAPPGAAFYATWLEDSASCVSPSDGKAMYVVLPTGQHWHIDGQCNNCGRPGDLVHKCWQRTGNIRDGTLHVDKSGDTCSAGGGSISVPRYHGFLRNGFLIEC